MIKPKDTLLSIIWCLFCLKKLHNLCRSYDETNACATYVIYLNFDRSQVSISFLLNWWVIFFLESIISTSFVIKRPNNMAYQFKGKFDDSHPKNIDASFYNTFFANFILCFAILSVVSSKTIFKSFFQLKNNVYSCIHLCRTPKSDGTPKSNGHIKVWWYVPTQMMWHVKPIVWNRLIK